MMWSLTGRSRLLTLAVASGSQPLPGNRILLRVSGTAVDVVMSEGDAVHFTADAAKTGRVPEPGAAPTGAESPGRSPCRTPTAG
ncbi:hypothetical protein IQ64_01625 [Streptomyces stelliscabiei]|uniref:Uncharacterized protein n=1 Tax=Streptomyces stelliscabiei TaxID=146820 RepID=A0A8I0NX16_9ACTN|nr:hypothetical protein [Streptomyces stelliscabiei]KND46401.1 hypothetical protein IQ64_01625 [Streptomyces stelliscabiei]MBE1595183.1 hypothetical protein [Streptomyces stelliscabiei]SOD81072.1 hypothetical protein SAMN06272781_7314 [Streptomyces sp. 1222.2]